jgi:hypothetical protein
VPRQPHHPPHHSQWPAIRTIILFVAGLLGVAWETLHGPVEPSLLVMFAAMMGVSITTWPKDNK